MKSLFFSILLALFSTVAFAQTVTVNNMSGCTITYYLYADKIGGCNPAYTTAVYSLPAGGTATWNWGSVAWAGPVPPPPPNFTWIGAAVIDQAGSCSVGVKVGEPCVLPPTGILKTTCSFCSATPLNVQWTSPVPPNKVLNIF